MKESTMIDIAIEVSEEIMQEYYRRYGSVGAEKYHDQMMAEIKEAVDDAIHEYEIECMKDKAMARFYGDDDSYDPYAYQQDIIDMYRFER